MLLGSLLGLYAFLQYLLRCLSNRILGLGLHTPAGLFCLLLLALGFTIFKVVVPFQPTAKGRARFALLAALMLCTSFTGLVAVYLHSEQYYTEKTKKNLDNSGAKARATLQKT